MDEHKVRNYLIEKIKPDKERTFGEYFRHHCRQLTIAIAVCLTIAFLAGVVSVNSSIVSKIAFASVLVSMPIIAMFALKSMRRKVTILETVNNVEKPRKSHVAGCGSVGGVAGMLGMIFARHFLGDFSQEALTLFIMLILWLILVFLTNVGCMYYYNRYLLKKYCPDLIDYKH